MFSTAFSIRQTELRIFAVQRKEFLKDHIQALILGACDTALIYILNRRFTVARSISKNTTVEKSIKCRIPA